MNANTFGMFENDSRQDRRATEINKVCYYKACIFIYCSQVEHLSSHSFSAVVRKHETKLSTPRREKACIRGFLPGKRQTNVYSHKRCCKACNFVLKKLHVKRL